ncbi:MAG: 7-cyano-7-deazaguanine synthase [Bacteroidota bacterium]
MNSQATILCMFSGGIDSSGVLHQLLTNSKYADNPVIVHHIHIVNRENRTQAEAQAVKAILSYYQSNIEKKFLYTESVFNTTGFAPLTSNRFPFDMDVCAFMAGNICVARKDIHQVAMGRTKTDLASGGTNFMERMNRAQAIFKGVFSLEKEAIPEYIFPVVEYTKEEIWNFLPEEVKATTWWCRRPVYRDGHAHPCGKCPTCLEVKAFRNGKV